MNPKSELIKAVSLRLLIALFSLTAITIAFLSISWWVGSDRAFTPCLPVLTGAIGGLVGLQRRMKRLPIDDLELLSSSRLYLYLSPFVGGLLAMLLFMLFLSGLIDGKLFPHFVLDPTEKNLDGSFILFGMGSDDPSDYAKLIFWSFIAGFSEKFVINVISQFQRYPDKADD